MSANGKTRLRLDYNAPAVLTFVLLCVAVQLVSLITGGESNRAVFSIHGSAFPMVLVRLFAHVLGHANWTHLLNNMMFILILGPMIEEKYGTSDTVFVILATALATGLAHLIFNPGTSLLGASGVVFAFILLASITGAQEHTIPLTFILVALLWIGEQAYNAFALQNNVSELTHIIGGAVGAGLGFVMKRDRMGRYGT